MVYVGSSSFKVCTYCSRMYNGERCPTCGHQGTREPTAADKKRWESKKHYANPANEIVGINIDFSCPSCGNNPDVDCICKPGG